MCNSNCITWAQSQLSASEVTGKRVLEVGALDINGSLRDTVTTLHPLEYIGVDARRGPGVDQVCFAEHLVRRFGFDRFDLVLASATLEHVRDWQEAVSNIKNVCSPGGTILIIVPSHWPYHPCPFDYWRFSQEDLQHIFSDCQVVTIAEDPSPPSLVYLKVSKPFDFKECDLEKYPVYAIQAERRLQSIHTFDLFSRQGTGIYFENIGDLLRLEIGRLIRFCSLAFQVRVLTPMQVLQRSLLRSGKH